MEVILLATISLDGFIAKEVQESSASWTSKEDLRWFAQKTKEIGVLIMGRTTFETIGRSLPGRQIIVMSSGGQPIATLLLGELDSVVVTNSTPEEILAALKQAGRTSVAICGGSSIYTQFISKRLVDRFYLTVNPVLFGRGVKLLSEPVAVALRQVSETELKPGVWVREFTALDL